MFHAKFHIAADEMIPETTVNNAPDTVLIFTYAVNL